MSAIPDYQSRYAEAQHTNTDDVWKHIKTGKTARVLRRVGTFGVALEHESGRKTVALEHYLASNFARVFA